MKTKNFPACNYSLVICLIAVLLISCKQKKTFKRETSVVEIGAERLQTYTGGEGENTIVFESGLGDDATAWLESGIFDSIGQHNQVIAYDRAGAGKSTLATGTRGIQAIADDLQEVIQKKSLNNKVILVSHSLGGAIARAYAIQHPDKIKALLFIEPNNENYAPYAIMSQGQEDTLVQAYKDANLAGAVMEATQLVENIGFLKQLPPLPDVPVIVITSTKTDGEMTPENVKSWSAAHKSLGKNITNFTQVTTNKSGHHVHREEPDLVIENIRKLLK